MKIKFIQVDSLPLKKMLEYFNMATVLIFVFHEDKKYYLQFF